MVSISGTTKNIHKDPLELMPDSFLKKNLQAIKDHQKFDLISATTITEPITIKFYKKWLTNHYHGDMAYLENHLPLKENPKLLDEKIKSAITIAFQYFPTHQPLKNPLPARTALYSKNEDYHFWLKDKLNSSISYLKTQYPNEIFLPYVDSGPVLERDLAYKSGLGWFGKNTCVIHSQKGSLFFLAEILTSLPVTDNIPLHEDLCGQCTKCIDICPTNALSEKQLDANKCISYLTIESKTTPPQELRSKIGDWFFGCDLCQTVCPWNQKKLNFLPAQDPQKSTNPLLALEKKDEEKLELFLKEILNSSNKKIQKIFYGTPLLRAGGFGMKRNALIIIANRKILTLKPEVQKYTEDTKLGELAQWTLQVLN